MRADSAQRVGINRGLALPCATPGLDTYVLAFLSALGTPIAKRIEVWMPDANSTGLVLSSGFCEAWGALGPQTCSTRIESGQGCVGEVWARGIPRISHAVAQQPGPAADVAGLSTLVAWPVIDEGWFVGTIALYF
jgi:hypothetical protein